mmetsp:Transcript_44595/g.105736  ORF Transcript_44595/g.105736 Transcript_44595/m.105736 type:complete len:579 (-) Transcript_44595:29-1765(-)
MYPGRCLSGGTHQSALQRTQKRHGTRDEVRPLGGGDDADAHPVSPTSPQGAQSQPLRASRHLQQLGLTRISSDLNAKREDSLPSASASPAAHSTRSEAIGNFAKTSRGKQPVSTRPGVQQQQVPSACRARTLPNRTPMASRAGSKQAAPTVERIASTTSTSSTQCSLNSPRSVYKSSASLRQPDQVQEEAPPSEAPVATAEEDGKRADESDGVQTIPAQKPCRFHMDHDSASGSEPALSRQGSDTEEQEATKSMSSRSRMRHRLGRPGLTVNVEPDDPAGRPENVTIRQLQPHETIETYYTLGEDIAGSGAISKISYATRKSDGAELVLKIRPKGRDNMGDRGWRQIMAQLRTMGKNLNVLEFSEILEDESKYYIAMPKCDGGELFDYLMTADEIPENECKQMIIEILRAIGHLHKNDLIHRDIKPENILFDRVDKSDPKSPKRLKLIDFDTVAEWTPESPRSKRFVGTPGYIAPEVLMGESTPQSDLWSVGVILYILMTGEAPWRSLSSLEDGVVNSPRAQRVYDELRKEPDWELEPWPQFPLARDLCQRLMAFDPAARPETVEEALSHAWLLAAGR